MRPFFYFLTRIGICSAFLIVTLFSCGALAAQTETDSRPNVIVILLDDMGYSDLGCYGASIIQTPTVDRLARQGLRFSRFYNTAKCGPTRAALLTGLYPQQAGFRGLEHGVTLAEVLREAGYFTLMSGKWHLSGHPMDRGFDRYFGHLNGAVDFFTGQWRGNDNDSPPQNHWRLGREVFNDFGDDFYTTKDETDYAIRFIDEAIDTGQPFFAYLAYNAPHYPLQAPKETVMKYRGQFGAVGWDQLRERRYRNQIEAGLIQARWELSPRPDYIPAWTELSERQRDWEDFRMSTYAAMIDLVDQNLKRLVDHLTARGQWDNTLLLLMSDNGGCGIERTDDPEVLPWEPNSFWTLDPGWANVNNTPFRWYKQHQHEGGTASPLIVHWTEGLQVTPGTISHHPAHLIDMMATLVEVSGASYPAHYGDRDILPMEGRSLLPLLEGKPREPHDWLFFNFAGRNRAIQVGDWKLVSAENARWELYNLHEDRTELHNLIHQQPALAEVLARFWHLTAERVAGLPENQRRPVNDQPPSIQRSWLR